MNDPIEYILDLARWAPSGDNEQPWRFERINETQLTIYGHDTRDWCVYDLDGHASQIALGALLQNIEIVASDLGFMTKITRRENLPETSPTFDVQLYRSEDVAPSKLLPFIEQRVTQRRPLSTASLTPEQKQQLQDSVGEDYRIVWMEGRKKRWQMARLLFKSAHIRLTIPEAYAVHTKTIEWHARFSEDKIPDQAIGVDSLTLKIMRWVLQSWRRVQFMNRYCLGTWAPRLQMDLIPGLRCAGHFLILSPKPLTCSDDYIQAGKAVQRFWLTATSLGLHFQPEMTPLIFSRYSAKNLTFSSIPNVTGAASDVSKLLGRITGIHDSADRGVFLGRVGSGPYPHARSIRKPYDDLTRS